MNIRKNILLALSSGLLLGLPWSVSALFLVGSHIKASYCEL